MAVRAAAGAGWSAATAVGAGMAIGAALAAAVVGAGMAGMVEVAAGGGGSGFAGKAIGWAAIGWGAAAKRATGAGDGLVPRAARP